MIVRRNSMLDNVNVSMTLLGIIAVFFFLQIILPKFTETMMFDPKNLQAYMFVTSIFLHGGIMHIFFNGYALFAFGPVLENRIGKWNFLALFFVAGIIGNILYYATIVLGIIPPIPALGASGAIYGILGALSVLMPGITLLFWGIIPMPIRVLTAVWIITEFLGAFNPYSGVGSAAHLGGLLLGIVFAMALGSGAARYREY